MLSFETAPLFCVYRVYCSFSDWKYENCNAPCQATEAQGPVDSVACPRASETVQTQVGVRTRIQARLVWTHWLRALDLVGVLEDR